MKDKEILQLSALELGKKIKFKEVSCQDALDAVFERIDGSEQELHCYVTVDRENAYSQAERVQRVIDEGRMTGLLAGVPMAVKDNICIEGMRTTCSSKMLENFVSPYTATAVKNLIGAGAIIIGKTNMDEFAMGSTTETSAFGPTKNPWDIERVPGGSSGGSCGAVAAAECFYALGSDTGGSIRQPSAFCGVTGVKPTYGTVSRYGLIAYGSSLDQIGPVGRNVADCAAILEVLASYDRADSTSLESLHRVGLEKSMERRNRMNRKEGGFSSELGDDLRGLRIGIPTDYLGEGLDEEIRKAVLGAADCLRDRGAVVEEFRLGMVEYAIPAYYVIASAEASSNLSRFDGVKYGYRAAGYEGLHEMYKKSRSEGFGREVKRRIMLGSFVLSSGYYDAYYMKALKTKALIKQAFDEAFLTYDVIMGPTAPATAPKLGESLKDPLAMYLGDIYTVSANLAGLPAISVPCGLDRNGLPMGLQLIGNCFQERTILQAAYAYEQSGEGTLPAKERR